MEFSWRKTDDNEEKVRYFLQQHGISGRLFKQVTGQGKILINNQLAASTGVRVHPGDQITIQLPPEKSDQRLTVSTQPIQVIYADNNWLVVNKPTGLASIPGPTNQTDTLLNRILGWLQQQNSPDTVPHVVTRLDRFTSGLVLLARHRFAHSLIARQLMDHSLDKRYYAIVAGHLTAKHGFLTQPIGRQGEAIRRQVMANGKAAKTEYWQVSKLATATLVKVKLYTGRTHQIRVHFTAQGHPLLGDQLYGGPLDQGIQRQALHAYELNFYDPFTQQVMHFTCPMPSDMQALLK
ncbi:RluA family pseudouridine synthase [Loigolactobacillus binensis]|uniref:Pseudouridine synthase n=1 Tax=Loigolactobacillus binensis TaxID=2559922 RepID=A0ABW3EBF8_9LACO|nr:RluA family pseudouridine synthase [Loigolactobacillus binensis]